MAGLTAIIGVNIYLIQRGPPGATSAVQRFDAHTELQVHGISDPAPHSLEAPESAPPPLDPLEKNEDAAPNDVDADPPDKESAKRKLDALAPKRSVTVSQASSRSCSTSIVEGLSRQIIVQARCEDVDAFASVPARPNLVTGTHVFLYLEATARDRLVRVLDAHPDRTMTVRSALRTVAQQYLLSRWASAKRCGIQLATLPGESNHETGLALDIGDPKAWRPALEQQGFRWLGAIDRVHFDFTGPGVTPHSGLDVLAFQQLWNRNHPDDRIAENGRYGAETEVRLKSSPAAGFPLGPKCSDVRGAGGSPSRLRAR